MLARPRSWARWRVLGGCGGRRAHVVEYAKGPDDVAPADEDPAEDEGSAPIPGGAKHKHLGCMSLYSVR